MPRLKQYTETSDQSGFYILASVGGSHPITLQVTDIGEQILRNAGYKPEDNVPTNVVWPLYDVGILYTNQTLDQQPDLTEATDDAFRQLDVANTLTSEELDQLLVYLDDYSGPNKAQVDVFKDELRDQRDGGGSSSSGGDSANQTGNETGDSESDQPRTFWDFIRILLKPPNLFSHGVIPGLIVWFLWFPIGVSLAVLLVSLYIPYKIAISILTDEEPADPE